MYPSAQICQCDGILFKVNSAIKTKVMDYYKKQREVQGSKTTKYHIMRRNNECVECFINDTRLLVFIMKDY